MSAAFDLTDRIAVVTGASSGLGERFTRVLAAAGATVVAAARRIERLEALAAEVSAVVPHGCDLVDDEGRQRLVTETLERFGRIDILVNNAGMGAPGAALDVELTRVRAVIELNLVAVFDLCRLAARSMIDSGGGTIINVSSMLGSVASMPLSDPAYNAAKAGVNGLARELACQWARQGVRVNAIAPGYFPSEMTGDLMADEGASSYVRRNTPIGRLGEPGELDGALLYLASDASTYCTGQVLTIDGGWTAR